MWARIQAGVVAETTNVDPTGRFHPALVWVACPAGTLDGDTYDGTAFAHPLSAAPVVLVPQSVSMVQATLALHAQSGSAAGKTMLDDVNAAVAAATDPRIALAWARATTLDRHGLFVTQMAPGLGLTDDKLDALFVAAAGISV